jgi:ABC-2 type transport system ATP-binding protein
MDDQIAIGAEGLTRRFGETLVVRGLTFSVRRGAVVGLLGRNGAGKTTAIRMLLGLLEPSRGSASLLGCDADALTPDVRRRIGYLPEGHPLFGWMTLGQAAGFFSGFYPEWRQDVLDRLVDYFAVPTGRKFRHMSRGERAQAALALTVARDPELLILDDPSQGIDAVARREFLAAVVALIRQEQRTVLFSSHLLADIERVCDRILILDHGVLRADCPVDTFKQSVRRVEAPPGADPAAWQGLPGLLTAEQLEDTWVLTLVDADGSGLGALRARLQGELEPVGLDLEEAFIAYTAERRTRSLDLTGGGQ